LEEIRIPLRPFLGPLIRGFFYWFVCIARNLTWCGLPSPHAIFRGVGFPART
jgi:hypothetical protein